MGYHKSRGRPGVARVTAIWLCFLCMLTMIFSLGVLTVRAASFDPGANGTNFARQEAAALIVSVGRAGTGDGFTGNYRYLTQDQLDSIADETSADRYFPSEKRETYLRNVGYSARTKDSQGGWGKYVFSGLDLAAVADSLGVSVDSDPMVYARGSDGYASSLANLFSTKRYAFDTGTAATGSIVEPAIALSGQDVAKSQFPRLVMGQTSVNDFNMLNWVKYLDTIWIGEKETALTLKVDGKRIAYTTADLIGTKSGRYTAQYQYMDGDAQVTAQVTGVPLDKFLADADIAGNFQITLENGTSIADPSKCMLAYEAQENGAPVKAESQVLLYGPGTTKAQVVTENCDSLTVKAAAPAAVTGLKAKKQGFDKVRLHWNKTSGAQGYNIYRYNKKTKKYSLLDCNEGNGKTSYVDKGLKTGKKYTYRIKAYVTVGGIDLESKYSNAASATPAFKKPAVKLSKAGAGAVKAKWSRVPGASGYQLRWGTNKKMTRGKKTCLIKKGTTTSKIIPKRDGQRRCYVKVRPYGVSNGKKTYGAYSKVKAM